ncbi:hypothetical protein [Phenylobacterium sp.]|uniref:hypothetical protein n=1 Tax=Phenylobacterium sp. TaxID=1871053 RepID=UPI0025CD5137|nr:hypothetical protein [Phenylobacterium sp.]MCA6285160.1 hypothetical protein [Phenylobacterium sp.]MCA6288551.1 hypothetical protein [Phenylobacterium sp.]MCA6309193.1 hypothetical protein [Phenylobacterium sp.]MCA6322847.1 hypothetical protein [Phenylobacterium sp.]MCA6336754.1 hypothetical protein [Phenylobacterium sp.]
MRSAVITLLAASAIALPAMAQEVPAPPLAPASAAETAAPAPAPPAPPPVVETLPTDGEIGQILNVIRTVCVPLVRGGELAKLATPAAGFKRNRREGGFTQTLVTRPYTLTVYDPGSNKQVCRLGLTYTSGGERPLLLGLDKFAFLNQPRLVLQRENNYIPPTDFMRVTSSWEYYTDKESIGLVFVQLKKPDGTEVNAKWGMGEILYSERQF